MTWLPMAKAPRDGTVIIVTAHNNGGFFVAPAAWMRPHGYADCENWWVFDSAGSSHETGELPTKVDLTVCTPVLWMPLPDQPPDSRLGRTLSNVLRAKPRKAAR